MASNNEFKQNIYNLIYKHKFITYKEFYSPELFAKIKQQIGLPQSQYRVVSIGLFPEIALYNEFYTLDSYQVNYDMNYKKEFRKIISKELDKSEELKSYFDNWGNRCYIYSSELGRNFFITDNRAVNNLEINTEQLKLMGCRYIFSAVQINNAPKLNLEFVNKFTDKNSPLTVYLYKL